MIITIKDKYIDISIFNKFYKDNRVRNGLLSIQEVATNKNYHHRWYNFNTKKLQEKQTKTTELIISTNKTLNHELPKGQYLVKFVITGESSHNIFINVE